MDKEDRTARIEAAAYDVLKEKGFKGASMLAIAKAAKASNETLYRWYGDKTGLFSALIERNAMVVAGELAKVRDTGATGLPALCAVGKTLLTMVTSEKAVSLNRAAAGDITGTLGQALATQGRGRVQPILAALMEEAYGPSPRIAEYTECYISLLIGDIQIRRATGAIEQPPQAELDARAEKAVEQLQIIYPLPATKASDDQTRV